MGTKAIDLEAIAKRKLAGTATEQDNADFKQAVDEGLRHAKGSTPEQANQEMQLRERQRQEMIKADPAAEARKAALAEAAASDAQNDHRFGLNIPTIDGMLGFARAFGAGEAPEATGMRNRLREDFIADMRDARQLYGIGAATKVLDRYEQEVIPAAKQEITKLQNDYQKAIAKAQQREIQLRLQNEVKTIAPEKALHVLEAAGLALRISEKGYIETAGTVDDRCEAILMVHAPAIMVNLRARSDFKPFKPGKKA
jgi:hypothetical protein